MSRLLSSTGTRPVRAEDGEPGGAGEAGDTEDGEEDGTAGEGFACGGFCIRADTTVPTEAGVRRKGTGSLNATTSVNAAPRDLVAEVEALGERLVTVRERIGEVIFGQTDVIEQALITI